ncbi:FUSC family protein [Psychromicrobium xiongbiense]|uniref:FUSC family protein n=1 Tax=Psychromicrobium xiongbiense TaxID=3051184 RepID=UPI00255265FF|nr:FUSC family protein [Psychromicrobium sp. YIM S02556]
MKATLGGTLQTAEVGFRAAVSVAIPLVVLLAMHRLDLAAYAVFGSFTAIYGSNERYRVRIRSLLVAAFTMVLGIFLGVSVAALGRPLELMVPALLLLVVSGLLLGAVFQLHPPTPVFQTFGMLVCAQMPTTVEEAWPRIGVGAAVAVLSVLLGLSGWSIRWALRRWNAQHPGVQLLFKELRREPVVDLAALLDRRVWVSVAEYVLAVVAAGSLALAFGLGHTYWAIVTVVAVLPPPRAPQTFARAWNRVVGTVGGLLLSGALLFWSPDPAVVVAAIVLCEGLAQMLLTQRYWAALLFITPMALALSYFGGPVDLGGLLADRIVETVLGAMMAMAVMLLVTAVTRRHARVG